MMIIDLMIQEHEYVERMLKVIRKICTKLMENKDIDYKDFDKIIYFIKNYADEHHHKKEEKILFKAMIEHLGDTAQMVVQHGMMVEHDYGRLYVRNLEEALDKLKNGDNEAKLDVIANAISYTHLLERHIEKENKVVFTFAKNKLNKEVLKSIDEECIIYEDNNKQNREKCLDILIELENKLF